jgi:hypothetical protein
MAMIDDAAKGLEVWSGHLERQSALLEEAVSQAEFGRLVAESEAASFAREALERRLEGLRAMEDLEAARHEAHERTLELEGLQRKVGAGAEEAGDGVGVAPEEEDELRIAGGGRLEWRQSVCDDQQAAMELWLDSVVARRDLKAAEAELRRLAGELAGALRRAEGMVAPEDHARIQEEVARLRGAMDGMVCRSELERAVEECGAVCSEWQALEEELHRTVSRLSGELGKLGRLGSLPEEEEEEEGGPRGGTQGLVPAAGRPPQPPRQASTHFRGLVESLLDCLRACGAEAGALQGIVASLPPASEHAELERGRSEVARLRRALRALEAARAGAGGARGAVPGEGPWSAARVWGARHGT